ncbi:DoxX-like family protein [Pedobacter sp. D749]|uniref:DoxX-like family protein n=1 Tax=Pedobacter sp. D749 TaxID=2856523 RepID=UPI001C5A0A49|nr:DoxX-like family protein [Pedobacter sp. D749]QXU41071.1 DoxX-like family protein [Pedobacter sp. D749]
MVTVINCKNQLLIRKILIWFIALVWLANGLFCKVLGLVPRHEQIVARILTSTYSHSLTILIGISEIVMAIWILSRFKTRLNAIVQIVVIATMNVIEFIFAPDLLLWGKFNSLFAFIFILIVFINGFYLNKK